MRKPGSGSWVTAEDVISALVLAFSVCRRAAVASTVICSVTCPICMPTSTRVTVFAVTMTPAEVNELKPSAVTLTS